jgi:aromatic-L-amino-acid decarboxylase
MSTLDPKHPRMEENASGGAGRLEFGAEAQSRWQWSSDEIKRFGYRVVDAIADHLNGIPAGRVFQPFPAEFAEAFLHGPVPASGIPAAEILDEILERIVPYPFGNGHPRFYGWVNSPPAVIGIFAEALAAAMNPSCAGGNHGAIYMERQVANWFKTILGFPPESMGLLTSGGSMATLTALAVARHARAGWDVRARGIQRGGPSLTMYMSQEGHSCIRKAVELLGVGSDNLRTIPVDGQYRMRVPDLRAALERDVAAGHRPVAVVASAGTVNTGAIDLLADLASICAQYGVWFHVDGAYGGPAILSTQFRDQLQGLALADSVALDPHKWMYIPVEAGLVVVRDAAAMRDAFSLSPPYLRTDGSPTGVGGLPWFSEFGFQQTRGFRALKVWMALKHHGLRGYVEAIERDIALARYLAARIEEAAELELAAPQSLSIVCFRYAPPEQRGNGEALDTLNKALLESVQLGGQAFLSSTTLGGRFVLRACIINPRTSRDDLDAVVDLVRATGARLRAGAQGA